MAVRKDEKTRREARAPFNNPFHDNLRTLKRGVRKREAQAMNAPNERGSGDDPSRSQHAETDEAAFRAAVADVEPLAAGAARVGSAPRASRRPGAGRLCTTSEDPTADENFDVRFSDQFIRGRAGGVSRETVSKLERGEFAVRSHVDLHGMPLDDARTTVDEFIKRCQTRGERCVLVITGKGRNSRRQIGVLREGIPHWLACGPSSRRLLAFVTARPCDGGEGALYVLLRRRATRKNRVDVESGGGV